MERWTRCVAFVDVVGFSLHLLRDEAAALQRWQDICRSEIDPSVVAAGGDVLERHGDGLLIAFPDAVSGLAWAIALQSRIAGPEAALAPDPMLVRIALHVADLLVSGGRVHGDGLVLAARLQEFADPGGIVMSQRAHELTSEQLRYDCVDLGPLALKNVPGRVRAFAIAGLRPAEALSAAAMPSHRPSLCVLRPQIVPADAVPVHVAEGLVHDITASLAGFRDLFVVASGSCLRLTEETSLPPAAVGRRLGVRYVLACALARGGSRLRLSSELLDAETTTIIWNDRRVFDVDELFGVQDAIATDIAHALLPHLRHSELQRALRKPPARMDAYDLVLQAMHRMYRMSAEDYAASAALLERALALDPGYAMAHALLAHLYNLLVGENLSPDPARDGQAALRHSAAALEHDPLDPLALAVHGHCTAFLLRRLEDARDIFDRALAASPNSAIAWGMSSPTYAYLGDGPTAVARGEYALRLSPLDPYAHVFHGYLGLAHYVNGTHEDGVRWSRRALSANGRFVGALRHLIGSLAALGRIEEAREAAGTLRALVPDFRVRVFLAGYPIRDRQRIEEYAARLLAAGLPE